MKANKRNVLIIAAGVTVVALILVLVLGGKKNANTNPSHGNGTATDTEIQPGPDGADSATQPDGDENDNSDPGTGECWNSKELSYTYDTYGNTITVGMKNGKRGDYIYINPKCSDTVSVGYYISSERSQIEIENGEKPIGDPNAVMGHPVSYEGFKGIKDFCILDRTYDTLNPAIYRSDKEYGARWFYDPLASVDGVDHAPDHVYIRAVEIASGNILAVMKLTISWTGDHFEMTSLESNDVYDTGEISATDRDVAVDRAIEFLRTKSTMDKDGINKDYWDTARKLTLVEHQGPYFLNFYDADNLATTRGYCAKYDTYAVNITLRGYGFVTVYLTPGIQLQGHSKKMIDKNNLDLQVFGYDAFYPATKDTLFVKDSFWIHTT